MNCLNDVSSSGANVIILDNLANGEKHFRFLTKQLNLLIAYQKVVIDEQIHRFRSFLFLSNHSES